MKFEVEKYKVSVIIPFYNRADWLSEAVDSVLKQTYSNLEIIVVNDGSPEDLTDFLKAYSDKIIYIEKENSGPGDTRNIGIENASGDYLSFLDSDDLWNPDKTKDQLEFMLQNDYVWTHTGGVYFWDYSDKIKSFNFSGNSGNVSKSGFISMKIATPSVMIFSSILRDNPDYRFNRSLRFSQDTFFYQLLSQRYVLGYFDKECVLIRMRSSDKRTSINASKRFRIRFLSRAYFYNFLNSSENKFFHNIPWFVKKISRLYFQINKFLLFLESKHIKQERIELISKFFYMIIYAVSNIYLFFMRISR